MKFGKIDDISGVDFTLSHEHPSNERLLSDYPHPSTCNVYIGATGWTTKEWKGRFYPTKVPQAEMLDYYGKQWNSIELNTTSYRTPDALTIEKWKGKVPDDFKFCPKVVQWVSNSNSLGTENGDLEKLVEAYVQFGSYYGCAFLQLPPHFSVDKKGVLEKFLYAFPDYLDLAVELRHPSWFESESIRSETQELFIKYGYSWLITDVAGRRDVAHMRLSTNYTMVRWVGNGLVDSDYKRIDNWVDILCDWHCAGLRNVYFFTHEPDNIFSPDIASYFSEKLLEEGCFQVRGPSKLSLF